MDRLKQLLSLLESEPDDVFLLYALAMEYISINQTDDAIAQLKLIKSKFPDYLPVYYQLGQLLELKQIDNEAILAYEVGMELALKLNNTKTYGELKSALEELTF